MLIRIRGAHRLEQPAIPARPPLTAAYAPARATALWCLFALLAAGVSASSTTAARDAEPRATLTIKVTDLRNHKGDLVFGVFKAADGFPTVKAKAVDWQVKAADADSVTFSVDLPPGKYSASVLHDENRNGQMDRNGLGVPTEGYGVTNNPKPAFRAATFEEARFTLPAEGAKLTISLQYF
ncbi:MAG: hypothetical protein JWP03_3427 [Phycisphaerales bacterium]|nr:hypothetical protein [Phycisphaerales bacterium]